MQICKKLTDISILLQLISTYEIDTQKYVCVSSIYYFCPSPHIYHRCYYSCRVFYWPCCKFLNTVSWVSSLNRITSVDEWDWLSTWLRRYSQFHQSWQKLRKWLELYKTVFAQCLSGLVPAGIHHSIYFPDFPHQILINNPKLEHILKHDFEFPLSLSWNR